MSDANTYKRGDSFEVRTYDLLKVLLDNEDFYVSGKRSKIFRKKGYYSEKRKSEIVFDIAIETYLPNSNDYSILTLIECKNYQSPVPINDLEEFDSKIRQISEHNTKGIVITNRSFQSGAFNFASSNGMALVRVNDNDDFEWIVNRVSGNSPPLKKKEAISLLENEDFQLEVDFIATNDNFVLLTVSELLIQTQVIDFFKHKEKFIQIPFVKKDRVEQIITRLSEYDIYTRKAMDQDKICKFLEGKYSIKFEFESDLPAGILGKIQFQPLKIVISKSPRSELARWRFTLAHEIGHLILHSKILTAKLAEKTDTEYSLSYKFTAPELNIKRLEYQANLFASHLLLPTNKLILDVHQYFWEENIHKGYLYWDNQPVNQQLVLRLLTRISSLYGVSTEVGRIRLITLGLLVDNRYKSLFEILKEMKYI